MKPVLVTGAGGGHGHGALGAVRALAAAGHPTHVTVSGPVSMASWSRHCTLALPVPAPSDPLYARVVRDLIASGRYAHVLPTSDPAMMALDWPGVDLLDKARLRDRAREAGIPVARGWEFPSGAALLDRGDALPFPVVVKPLLNGGVVGINAWRADAPADLEPARAGTGPLYVEEWLEGPARQICAVVWGGKLRAVTHQQPSRTWPRGCGVSSASATVAPDTELEHLLLDLLGGHEGIVQAQFIGGRLHDLNPRVYGSIALSTRAGVNLPDIATRLAAGEEIGVDQPVRAMEGVQYRWLEGDLRHVAAAVRAGDMSGREALAVCRSQIGAAQADLRLSDPAPVLARAASVVARRTGHADVSPSPQVSRDRERAHAEVAQRVGDAAILRTSPLGPAWSGDVDVHAADPPGAADLVGHGWVPLDGLLARIGSRAAGRWAVVTGEEIVGAADVQDGEVPDPTVCALDRARRRGRVTAREIAEITAAGGDVSRVSAIRPGLMTWLRQGVRDVRRRLRPRVAVAVSGVDGAGKSTLATRLVDDLHRAGVPATSVSVRPGNLSPVVATSAVLVKRLLRRDPRPGWSIAATGSCGPASRHGLLGRLWTGVVVADFCALAWTRYLRGTGVVVFDRHAIDAIATLRVLYGWQGHGLAEWVVSTCHPRADLHVYLDISLEAAVARKPGDVVGEWAVTRQLDEYSQLLSDGTTVIQDAGSPAHTSLTVLRMLAGGG